VNEAAFLRQEGSFNPQPEAQARGGMDAA